MINEPKSTVVPYTTNNSKKAISDQKNLQQQKRYNISGKKSNKKQMSYLWRRIKIIKCDICELRDTLFSHYAFIIICHVHIMVLKVPYHKKSQLSSNSKTFQSNIPVGLFMKLDMLFLECIQKQKKKEDDFSLEEERKAGKGRKGKKKEDWGPHATSSQDITEVITVIKIVLY